MHNILCWCFLCQLHTARVMMRDEWLELRQERIVKIWNRCRGVLCNSTDWSLLVTSASLLKPTLIVVFLCSPDCIQWSGTLLVTHPYFPPTQLLSLLYTFTTSEHQIHRTDWCELDWLHQVFSLQHTSAFTSVSLNNHDSEVVNDIRGDETLGKKLVGIIDWCVLLIFLLPV